MRQRDVSGIRGFGAFKIAFARDFSAAKRAESSLSRRCDAKFRVAMFVALENENVGPDFTSRLPDLEEREHPCSQLKMRARMLALPTQIMRVAITGFLAQSIFGDQNRHWNSKTAQFGELQNSNFSPAGFSPQWGEILLRDAGFYSRNQPKCAVSFGSSKGYAPFGDFDSRAYETDALRIANCAQICGPVLCPVAACATGAHSIALGAAMIARGEMDLVLAGAREKPQPPEILAAYKNMGALSKSGIMRPFDARRDGFLPSFGSAIMLLESETRARKRGADVFGFLTGYSLGCDAHHMTSMCPSGDSIARAIENALEMAGNPRIDYINAHGTATRNDAIEARAISKVFGEKVPISSTKPLTGHLLGAAGAVEAVVCLSAMREGFAPPNLNVEESDLKGDFILGEGRKMEIGASLSLSYGFGGHIGVLVIENFSKWKKNEIQ